ncbi:MAG: FKBP-type peptidyl-prolyl cis-trans isomerase [Desulfobulbaceae bacterium]|nr:FKBP-type peptidyl-prolyl cis-trans isomerase [Desulfobulbaceae bacterium]
MQCYWRFFVAVICFAAVSLVKEAKAIDLPDLASKQGYSIGYQLGADFKAKEIVIRPESLVAGINDAMAGSEPSLPQEQMSQVVSDLQKHVEEKRRVLFQKLAAENKLAEEKFFVENSTKEGVIVLPSGLQYKIVKEGIGQKPTATASVTVDYRGTLPDGTEFDSSYKRGKAATFPVNRVIAGWTEALQLMPVGSKWILYVPSALAYGERGPNQKIGPNQLLIFEVELLAVE